MIARFRDRVDAGRALAVRLSNWANCPDVIVLALPRGGVPVGYEVARALNAPLDVFLVRKLGVPWQPELAMGAIASGGVRVLNDEVLWQAGITAEMLERVAETEARELERREHLYRGAQPPPDIGDRVVILVDDGLATGSTMRAAIRALRLQHPRRIIAASPAGAPFVCEEIGREADEAVCAITPEPFQAVGAWYEDFSETTDDDVRSLLARAHAPAPVVEQLCADEAGRWERG